MLPRKITNEELADLPESWENATVDVSKYFPCVMRAYEVNEETYTQCKDDGDMCMVYKFRYYVAY